MANDRPFFTLQEVIEERLRRMASSKEDLDWSDWPYIILTMAGVTKPHQVVQLETGSGLSLCGDLETFKRQVFAQQVREGIERFGVQGSHSHTWANLRHFVAWERILTLLKVAATRRHSTPIAAQAQRKRGSASFGR